MKNKDYLGTFLFSGFAGIGCKMILSANSKDNDQHLLDNIPIASAISDVLILRAISLLPDIEVDEDH